MTGAAFRVARRKPSGLAHRRLWACRRRRAVISGGLGVATAPRVRRHITSESRRTAPSPPALYATELPLHWSAPGIRTRSET
jgi:hypothetical protein